MTPSDPGRASLKERAARARELGNRCNGHPEHVDDALPRLLQLLQGETDPPVLAAIAEALGHMWDHRTLQPLLALLAHPTTAVRLAAVQALPGALADAEDPRGVAALIDATTDADTEIRDWATFGLAQLDADGPEVRSALIARISDPAGATAGEALLGLARRGDARVLDPILDWLHSGDVGNLIVEAAGELGDARLLPALRTLQAQGWDDDPERLAEALRRCSAA